MRVGVLTGGGDCPGLNAVIRAIVRKGVPDYGYSFLGFRDGWRGPLEALTSRWTSRPCGACSPAAARSSALVATNPFAIDGGVEKIKRNLQNLGVDALIAIGGEDTLGVATKLHEMGVNVVGVPKTIDNDLSGTDYTFGFDTAVNIAMEAIDRLHTTAESHHRALIVEVMGRHAGWIALHSGMAGGANVDPHPRGAVRHRAGLPVGRAAVPARLRADHRRRRGRQAQGGRGVAALRREGRVRARAARRHRRLAGQGDRGAHRQGGAHHGARARAARRHPDRPRPLAGHPLRPARDRRGARPRSGARWSALRGTDIVTVPLAEATKELKVVDPALYAEAEVFFG